MYPVSDEYIAAMRAPVRRDKITGAIKLRNGTIIPIDDSIIAQSSLSVTRSVCTGKFDIGTANCAELKITIFDDGANDNEYGGALVKLTYSLCTNWTDDVWESVPLPPFWADGTQVTRKRNRLTIKAYDGLSKLDVSMPDAASIPADSLYNALQYIVNYGAGMGLAISEDDFAKLPNADITGYSFANTKIQSCRDAVMWIAQLTATCAFTDYRGLLMLKTHSYDEGGSYDRGIRAQERTSIEFTDTRTYLAYLAYYCMGERKNYSDVVGSWGNDDEHIRDGALNLPENPLVENLDETAQDAAATAYFTARSRPTRYIKAQGLIDPAVEPLDVLAFVGGSIDVHGGRIIAPVTSVLWKYRGSGNYTCLNYDEYSENESETAAVALLADEDAESETTAPVRVPTKSQTEKRIDDIESRLGKGAFPPTPIEYNFKQFTNVDPTAGGGFEFKSKDKTTQFALSENGIELSRRNAVNGYRSYISANTYLYAYVENSTDKNRAEVTFSPNSFNISGRSDGKNTYQAYNANGMLYAAAYSDGKLCAQISINGSECVINYGSNYRLTLDSTGLYINNKKVLTEE